MDNDRCMEETKVDSENVGGGTVMISRRVYVYVCERERCVLVRKVQSDFGGKSSTILARDQLMEMLWLLMYY